MFWVDEIVKDIIKGKNQPSYLITDWMTTSGHAHIGSLRGVVVHDLIREGLEKSDKKAYFQWGFDDFDPMDGFPNYLDPSFKKYMGMPFCNIPAPDKKHVSFADQYADEFLKIIKKLSIEPKVIYNSKLYKSGKYNQVIRIILDSAAEIRKIYKKISGSDKKSDWYPLQIVCPKCGKIGTTRVFSWNGQEVEFKCEENLVNWAKGCGYQGKISPFDGQGKLPWKVEWPSKWLITKTDIEGEGKDHFVAGGSRDIADEIMRKVFKKIPPYDIRYEHFLIDGAKMSSSKGLGIYANEMSKFLPANILRFLFTRTKYKKAIDFNPEGDTISNLFDEFDRASQAFSHDPNSDLGRAFYYAETKKKEKQSQFRMRFSTLAYLVQMPNVDLDRKAQEEKGSKLNQEEKKDLEIRHKFVKKWLEKYAPENYKFEVQKELPNQAKDLNKKQREFLVQILDLIKQKSWKGKDLHTKIHEIRKKLVIDPREAFSAIYLIFIGKDSGPQAGWFLASLDRDFAIKRLKEAVKI